MRGRLRSLAASTVAATLLAAGALSQNTAANAAGGPVIRAAYFTDPLTFQTNESGGPSDITEAILRLLEEAANTATVRIAMFEATMMGDQQIPVVGGDVQLIEQQLVSDLNRGVTVYVIYDLKRPDGRTIPNDLWTAVQSDSALTHDGLLRFHPQYCANSCYTGAADSVGIMHNKFMIIDQAALPNVNPVGFSVLQSSANWTYGQLNSHFWNNAVEIDDDAGLYDNYLAYWNEMHTCAVSTPHYCTGYPTNQFFIGDGGEQVHTLPSTSDPVVTALSHIDSCSLTQHTTIDIAMNSWKTDDRGSNKILGELRDLDNSLCPVRIVVPANAPIAGSLSRSDSLSLKAHCTGGLVKDTLGLVPNTAPAEHNKDMLINGSFGGIQSQIVFTGSQRFNATSLNDDDEVWMRLDNSTSGVNVQDAGLFAQYEDNFNQIWNSAPLCSETTATGVDTDDDSLDS